MTKNYKFLKKATMLLLSFLAVPFGMLGQTEVTYTFSENYSSNTVLDGVNIAIDDVITAQFNKRDGGTATQYYTNGSAVRWYGGGTLEISSSNATISEIVVTFTQTANSISTNVGTYSSGTWTGEASSVTFTQSGTTGQCRISSIKVTYTTSGGSALENNDLALTDAPVALTFDLYNNSDPQVINYTTSSTGAVTIAASDFYETEIDETNQTITVTPVAVTNGAKEVTVSQAADDTYKSGSATFTVNITDSTPFEGGDVTFVAGTDKGSTTTNADGDEMTKAVVIVSSSCAAFATAEYRLYSGSTTTISTTSGTITKIVFTKTGNYSLSNLSTTTGTYDSSTGTWTGDAQSVSFSASAQVRLSTIAVTVFVAGEDPYINASNVNIAYDATEGEIAYTITNPVTDKTLQATADVDWVSNIEVGAEAITFTTTANEAKTERVATFTLTYEGAEDKTVTVTQAGNPNIIDKIENISESGVPYNVQGTVVATSASAFVIGDGTGFIYTYLGSAPSWSVGDMVKISGTTSSYNQVIQFPNSATITVATESEYTPLTPAAMTEVPDYTSGLYKSDYYQFEGMLTKEGNYYVVAVGEGQIRISYPSTSQTTELDALLNKMVKVNGFFAGNSANGSGVFTAIMESIEEVVSTDPTVTVSPTSVSVDAAEHDGYITVTPENMSTNLTISVSEVDSEGTTTDYGWLEAEIDEGNVYYVIDANTGEARTAYLKVAVTDNDATETYYSNLIPVTQAAPVIDYATLPFTFDGGKADVEGTNGLTATYLGSDYSNSPKLKFESKNNNISSLTLKTNSMPKAITFDIKGNGSNPNPWSGTFKVQISEDNITYSDLVTYIDDDLTSDAQTFTLINTNANVRFIKWIYTEKTVGNVALGNIYVDKEYLVRGNATVSEDLTLIACEIESEGKLTIESGATFEVTEPYALYNGGTSSNLVIKDGGQLKTPNEVFATVEKDIIGYTQDNYYTNKGYYLVSAPAEKYLYVASSNADVDAYMFDASEEGEEWRNFKGAQGAWNISASSAILYATKENSILSLDGKGIVYNQANQGANEVANKVPATTTNIEIDIRFNSGKAFEGYNLIGNPFTCTAYLADGREFLRMNEDGDGFVWTSGAISVCEGIFVVAESSSDNKVTFTTTNPTDGNAGPAALTLNLTQSRGNVIDNARIRFGEGRNFAKFALNESNARVSFTQGNKEYSLVRSNGQGEMPVNFKAAENGTYTLSFDMENVAFDNLRLIDNLTGVETDLLAVPSYTFTARTTDYASRFRLVFSANNVNQNAENDTFAYFNGSEWVINGSDNATIQVIDMMGRVVLSGTNTIATNDMQAGVYVIRLVDGNNVKTQKIVVQ